MRFIQAKHPAICWPLLPWFVEGDQTRKEIFMELYGRLEQEPENTFVEVVLDGDMCKGVLVGYVSGDHIWIWQARAKKDFKQGKRMFGDLIAWATRKGKNELRAGCSKNKNMKLFMRRFGFKKDGREIKRIIA